MAIGPRDNSKAERRMINSLDKMRAFEAFEAFFPKEIRDALAAGLTAQEILQKYEHLAAAVLVTKALTGKGNESINASKDILDRIQGKAVEKKEVKHTLDKLPDEQLDALLLTELEDMGPGLPPGPGSSPISPAPEKTKKKRGRPTKTQTVLEKMKKAGIIKDKP